MQHARTDYNERIIDTAGLIPADEPVFLLRAHDMLAAEILARYIALLVASGSYSVDYIEALRTHQRRFMDWPDKSLPDVPDIVG